MLYLARVYEVICMTELLADNIALNIQFQKI